MSRVRSLTLALSTIFASICLFGAAGYLGGHAFTESQNRIQLGQLDRFVLGEPSWRSTSRSWR